MKKIIHTGPIDVRQVHCSADEHLVVNGDFFEMLSKEKLLLFSEIWSFSGGKIVKQTKNRTVIQTQIPWNRPQNDGNRNKGEAATLFYIKKHDEHLSLWQKLLSLVLPDSFNSEGIKEFDNYCEFREKGLETVIPVAAGMKFSSFLHVESFLITKDFSPFVDLEELVLNRPETLFGKKNKTKKRNILKAIANYARRMHDSGLNQKDFNATHVLLLNLETKQPKISLFDLQRVDKNTCNRFKWPIKSLAELNYTLPVHLFTEDDRRYLFQKYLRKNSLNFLNKLQWAWIRKKTAKIARHSKKRGLAPKMSDS